MRLFLLLTLLTLIGCKTERAEVTGYAGKDGTTLVLKETSFGALLITSKKVVKIYHGDEGPMGPPGNDGLLGPSGSTGLTGPAGIDGLPGKDGKDGLQGPPGKNGKDGKNGPRGYTGPAGIDGLPGKDGKDGLQGPPGKNGSELQVFRVPIRNNCVLIAPGIYVKNEGDHADFYNNDTCRHSGGSNKAFCNDVSDAEDGAPPNEVCHVIYNTKVYKFTIQGQHSDLCVIRELFKDTPTPITLN